MMFHPFDRDMLAHPALASVWLAMTFHGAPAHARRRAARRQERAHRVHGHVPPHRRPARALPRRRPRARLHHQRRPGGEHHPRARRVRVQRARARRRGARARARDRRALRGGRRDGERREGRDRRAPGLPRHAQQHGDGAALRRAPRRRSSAAARRARPTRASAPAAPTWATSRTSCRRSIRTSRSSTRTRRSATSTASPTPPAAIAASRTACDAAKALARTAVELLTDESLRRDGARGVASGRVNRALAARALPSPRSCSLGVAHLPTQPRPPAARSRSRRRARAPAPLPAAPAARRSGSLPPPPSKRSRSAAARARRPARPRSAAHEVRQVPGAFGDAFRVMEALPGVTPLVSGLPFFFVRGAPPGNNGYYIDGIRVPLLYHVGAGPERHPPRPHRARRLLSRRLSRALRTLRRRHSLGRDAKAGRRAPRRGQRPPLRRRRARRGAVRRRPRHGPRRRSLLVHRGAHLARRSRRRARLLGLPGARHVEARAQGHDRALRVRQLRLLRREEIERRDAHRASRRSSIASMRAGITSSRTTERCGSQ